MTTRKASVAIAGLLLIAVTACTQEGEPTKAPVSTTTATLTVVQTPSSITSEPDAYSSESSSSESSASALATPSAASPIRSIVVNVSSSDSVGPNLLQLSYGDANVNVDIRSRGEDGDVSSNECMTIVDVTGPGNYDERRRSANCTANFGFPSAKVAGTYTVKAQITPPGATTATVANHTFRVVGAGE